jgi:DNA-binding MltR family transcriptional regulator
MDSHESKWFDKEEYLIESDKRIKPWWDALERESDISLGIISATLLDILLEEVIRTFYVKDKHVADLFKNDHLLMNFYSKINLAYYSGYIPKVIYHDLKIICKIRNKFAHSLLAGLDFKEKTLVSLIQECELRPKTMDDVFAPKLKYVLIVQQLADHLIMISHTARKMRPRKFVEYLNMEKWDFSKATLTKSKLEKLLKESHRNLK